MVEFLEATARLRMDTTEFASLVTQAAAEGDAAACRILSDAGERHGANAVHVLRRLGMQDLEFDLVLAGGLFRSVSPLLQDAVERMVRPVAPGATFILLKAPPVVGAVLMAIELGGAAVPLELRPALASAAATALGLPVG